MVNFLVSVDAKLNRIKMGFSKKSLTESGSAKVKLNVLEAVLSMFPISLREMKHVGTKTPGLMKNKQS